MFHAVLPFLVVLPTCCYLLITVFVGRKYFRRHRMPLHYTPPVTILKPVKGADPEGYHNFASFCRQDYPDFQIVFAVADPEDPVVPVLRKLMGDFPQVDIDLVIDSRVYGPNYKVANLINAYPKAKYDIIIVCDSDIRVPAGYLSDVCSRFSDPEVGLVTSLYRTSSVLNVAAAVEALGFTAEMIPNVMVARQMEGLSFALGASMAVRREALEKIGGFVSLAHYLADDYQLGNKIHRAGYRLELSDLFVESMMSASESFALILSRQIRWGRTMRVSRPGGYLGVVMTHPFPFAVAALALSGFSASGWGAAGALYGIRFVASTIYSRRYIGDRLLPSWLWLLPLRDLLSFLAWILAFAGNSICWRGHVYRLKKDGTLVELQT